MLCSGGGGNDQKSLATFARVLYIVDYLGLTLPAPARLLGKTSLEILPSPSHLSRLVEGGGGMGHSINIYPPWLCTVNPMGPVLALCLIRHKMCSFASIVTKRENVVTILAFIVCHEP
jgi:hypothetical protein